ncbi:MAG: hypothetical protein J6B89_00670 [Bacilli bacterium]|nr:hypothetical protein [Bacilli bacterium]
MEFVDYDLINKDNLFSDDSDFLYKCRAGCLLKIVPNGVDYYRALREKKLDNCNLPIDVYNVDSRILASMGVSGGCAITIPKLSGYMNMDFCSTFNNLETIGLLEFLKKQMLSLKLMHDSCVFHGDISVSNILMNQDLNFQFIDFDLGVVDSYVSVWNIYEGVDNVISSISNIDKLDLFDIYLKQFLGIKQYDDIKTSEYEYLLMPREIIQMILDYRNHGNIPNDYYFIDVIDYLISTEYISPFIKMKSLMKK